GLAPGASMTLTIQNPPNFLVPAGGCTVATPCSWETGLVGQQSNDFSGPPGNDLTFDPSTSNVSSVLGKLRFRVQPPDAHLNPSISGIAGDPTGPAVTVQVVDSANPAMVTAYDGPVTVALNNPAGVNGTLHGTTTQTAAAGTASFGNLSVDTVAYGYTL